MIRRTFLTSSQTTIPILTVGTSILAVLITSWLVSQDEPLMGIHISLGLLLIVICATLDYRRDQDLVFLLRPAAAVAASVVVGSVAAPALNSASYKQFMILWVLLVAGVLLGLFFSQSRITTGSKPYLRLDSQVLIRASFVVLFLSYACAAFFFAWQGVPALSGNVEQSRVDAAEGGTGYFRLMAYLSIPAIHMLFALRHKVALPALILTTLAILGLANRSPLLYLFVPLLLIFASQKRLRLSSGRILLAVGLIAIAILSLGAFRVFSQEDFVRYEEYRADISSQNYVGVALTTLTQYAEVVADNAVLTKSLVDSGDIPLQFGSTYLTLFISAAPGEQLSLDRLIKSASGKSFVGGGTPPTLMGEGYVNFSYPGVIAAGAFVVLLLRYWSERYRTAVAHDDPFVGSTTAAVYGYMLCWVVGTPVAGLAGASTFPLAGAILIVALRAIAMRYGSRVK